MVPPYQKVFSLGTDFIGSILDDEVVVQEKVDGSLFGFAKIDGELFCRSKGQQVILGDNGSEMFQDGAQYINSIAETIPDGIAFYCEYLKKPKHNVLHYERTPTNMLCLFDAFNLTTKKYYSYDELKDFADKMGIDVVPVLYKGFIKSQEEIKAFLQQDSYLGNNKVEGIVVKNYTRNFLLGGQVIYAMFGKFVSEEFKEVHRKTWKSNHDSKSKWQIFKEGYKTESRWEKAFQHLRDNGELENTPRDIPKLIIEVQKDIGEEEKEIIKKFLWQEFGKELLRGATHGLPTWYKEKLTSNLFNNEVQEN